MDIFVNETPQLPNDIWHLIFQWRSLFWLKDILKENHIDPDLFFDFLRKIKGVIHAQTLLSCILNKNKYENIEIVHQLWYDPNLQKNKQQQENDDKKIIDEKINEQNNVNIESDSDDDISDDSHFEDDDSDDDISDEDDYSDGDENKNNSKRLHFSDDLYEYKENSVFICENCGEVLEELFYQKSIHRQLFSKNSTFKIDFLQMNSKYGDPIQHLKSNAFNVDYIYFDPETLTFKGLPYQISDFVMNPRFKIVSLENSSKYSIRNKNSIYNLTCIHAWHPFIRRKDIDRKTFYRILAIENNGKFHYDLEKHKFYQKIIHNASNSKNPFDASEEEIIDSELQIDDEMEGVEEESEDGLIYELKSKNFFDGLYFNLLIDKIEKGFFDELKFQKYSNYSHEMYHDLYGSFLNISVDHFHDLVEKYEEIIQNSESPVPAWFYDMVYSYKNSIMKMTTTIRERYVGKEQLEAFRLFSSLLRIFKLTSKRIKCVNLKQFFN